MFRLRGICATTMVAAAVVAPTASAQGVGHRIETLTVKGSAQQENRKVPVHLWYPAQTGTAATTVYRSTLHGRTLLPDVWDPLAWTVEAVLARETSAIAGGPFPLIVFSHGATNDPIDYAWTLERIAARGFVVAAPHHTNNTQDDVRIDAANTAAAALGRPERWPCEDGRPGPCSRTDNARSIDDRVRDVSAILDAAPGWFGNQVDAAKAGVLGHSRGTITALGAAGGSTAWGIAAEPRVQAIMGMAIGARGLRDNINLPAVKVPTFLVAGSLDRNTAPAISTEAIAAIGSADKRYLEIPNATHRTFDSTYCAQLQSAGAIAQGNPRAFLDQLSVPLIASSAPGGVSGKAVHYCASSYLTTPVDIRPLIAATPSSEYPPAIVAGGVCSVTTIPCTGLETEAVSAQITDLAAEFFAAKLARAASGTVAGTVPATLALGLTPASFGAFTPGVEQDYTATGTATVTSTAGDATLSVSDPGHLTNGPFSLAEPLRVAFSTAAWAGPTSNERVTVTFRQLVKRTDPLRTGTYSRTLTFTLSTTSP